jgi:hypothetical protein
MARLPTDKHSILVLILPSYCSSTKCMCNVRHGDKGHNAGARQDASRKLSMCTCGVRPVDWLSDLRYGDKVLLALRTPGGYRSPRLM